MNASIFHHRQHPAVVFACRRVALFNHEAAKYKQIKFSGHKENSQCIQVLQSLSYAIISSHYTIGNDGNVL